MRFMKYLILLTLLVCSSGQAREDASCATILDHVHTELPHYGVLKSTERWVYVDLDDAYIHTLIGFIQSEGFEEPPYFGTADLVGAHITVVYPEEMEQCEIRVIEEDGEVISFIPTQCEIVPSPRRQGIDEVSLIIVEAPALDRIRQKYGLPKRKYPFHITFGVKRTAAS